MSSDSEVSSLTPSQEGSEKGNDSDEAEEEEGENPPNDNPDNNVERDPPVEARSFSISPAQENEFDYEEEEEDAIHLDNNDDMNYEEEEGNEEDAFTKNQNVEDEANCQQIDTTEEFAPADHFGEVEELRGEDISAGESDEEDEGEIRETDCKEEIKMEMDAKNDIENDVGEELEENLEDGEIIDSDDGIPEIKGSMSPPEMADDFAKSFDTQHNYVHDNNKSGSGYQQQQFEFGQPQHYEHREREQCRFFLRGNCKNGDACRFKHSFTTNTRGQFQSKIGINRPQNYNTPVPPPVGPPIPLLSTEFAPPPSLAPFIRPAGPVNTDSAAWEQGLKKAREIVRRQKTETTSTKEEDEEKEEEEAADNKSNKSEESFGKEFEAIDTKSPQQFAAAELTKSKGEEQPKHFPQHRQYFPPSNAQNHHHRPIASRMVVEYVSVVTTSGGTSSGSYGQRKGNEKSRAPIPSLIDNIIVKPMSPPPRDRAHGKTKQRDRDGRRTFESSNYSDPWARQNSSGGDHDGGKRGDGWRNQQTTRKQRRRSASAESSLSDGGPTKRRVRRPSPSSTHHHRHEEGRGNQQQSRRHSISQQQNRHHHHNSLTNKKETSMERGDERKAEAKREKGGDSGKTNLRRNDSASSRASNSSSKKGEKNVKIVGMAHGKPPSSRSSSVSSTTSTSTDSSREEAATLGSLLKTTTHHPTGTTQSSASKCKGPKTPPTPADQRRPSSESTSASSRSRSFNRAQNRKKRGNERLPSKEMEKSANTRSRQLDEQRRFSRGSNQSNENDGKRLHSQLSRSSFLRNEEEEEEDAPAAYRIPRKTSDEQKRKGRGDRASSTSSMSSSSSSSSDTSSNSSTIGRGQRKNKPVEGDGKTMATICSSERNNMRMPAVSSLDDKVDPISSDDDADEGRTNGREMEERAEKKRGIGAEKQQAKTIVGRTNSKGNGQEVAGAKGQIASASGVDDPSSSSSSNAQNSKEESSRKRKFELLQKLESVEKAIARKKQRMDGGTEE